MKSSYSDEQKFVLAASPPAWKDYADELHRSASILWEARDQGLLASSDGLGHLMKKSHISRTYLLLAALSIENLLKGVIVAQQPSLVANSELSQKIKKHELLKLASLIDEFSLDEEEIRFCEVAQEAIPYWGRYPSPQYSKDLTLEKIATDEYHTIYENLFGRLSRYLYGLIRNGWSGPHDMLLRSHVDPSLDDVG